jgi:hypothetical protein
VLIFLGEQKMKEHYRKMAYIRNLVQSQLGEMYLASLGQCKDRQIAIRNKKAAIKAAWQDVKKIAMAKPELIKHQNLTLIVWSSNEGHSKSERFELAVQQLMSHCTENS